MRPKFRTRLTWLTRLAGLIPLLDIVSLFIRADNLQRVLFIVGSCHLTCGANPLLFRVDRGFRPGFGAVGLKLPKIKEFICVRFYLISYSTVWLNIVRGR